MVVVRSDPRTYTTVASWLSVLSNPLSSDPQAAPALRLRSLPGSQFSDTPMPLLLNVPWSWVLEHLLSVFEHPMLSLLKTFWLSVLGHLPCPQPLKPHALSPPQKLLGSQSSDRLMLSVLEPPCFQSSQTPWLSAFIQPHAPSARKPSGSQPSITPMLSVLEPPHAFSPRTPPSSQFLNMPWRKDNSFCRHSLNAP